MTSLTIDASELPINSRPGTAFRLRDQIAVRCADNDAVIVLKKVKPEGRKELNAIDWWNGEKSQTKSVAGIISL